MTKSSDALAVPGQLDDTPVAMDQHVALLAEERECAEMITWWEQRRNRCQAQLAEIMGTHTTGTVNGIEVITYKPKEQFRGGEFKKQYPDMYHLFSRARTMTAFDAQWLKETRPDLYREFQTRQMLVTFKEPGKASPHA